MRIHCENVTADDADLLSGTSLDMLEGGGQLDIMLLSTQADTLIDITGPDSEPIILQGEIPQETRAIRPADDISFSLPVVQGGHYTVNINIATGATVQAMCIYRKAGIDY